MPARSRAPRAVLASALGVTCLLLVTGCGSSAPPSPNASASNAAGPTSSVPSSPASAPATGPATGASAPNPVAAWYAGTRGLFAAVQSDTEQVASAAGTKDMSSLRSACARLSRDVARVQAAPAAPDKRIAAAVGNAAQDYASAARSCLAGDYGGAADGINQGAAELQRANSIMASFS